MNDIKVLLADVENRYLNDLLANTKALFENENIPSHNEYHHLRVWKYASEIVIELSRKNTEIKITDLELLIISAFFHDTGLVYDKGTRHGRSGALLCEKWLDEWSLKGRLDTEKILHAIENHDNKEYKGHTSLTMDGRINLPAVLNICDDLDAFGVTGIYRYTEIYLLRGISLSELGNQVLSNVSRRFSNFLIQCMNLPVLTDLHTPRFREVEEFFEHYNSQLKNQDQEDARKSGPYAIVEFISRHIHGRKFSIRSLCESGMQEFSQGCEREFFKKLGGSNWEKNMKIT